MGKFVSLQKNANRKEKEKETKARERGKETDTREKDVRKEKGRDRQQDAGRVEEPLPVGEPKRKRRSEVIERGAADKEVGNTEGNDDDKGTGQVACCCDSTGLG